MNKKIKASVKINQNPKWIAEIELFNKLLKTTQKA